MIEYLSSAITGIKAAKDIAVAIKDLQDFDKISTATIELKERLIEITDNVLASKEHLLALQKQIADTEKGNERLNDWIEEKKRYARKQIAPGVFAYVENDLQGPFENAHKYCCSCMEKTIQSTLQQGIIISEHKMGRMKTLTCPNGCPNLEFGNYIDQN